MTIPTEPLTLVPGSPGVIQLPADSMARVLAGRIAPQLVTAFNNTYAAGINPEGVEDLRDALFKLHSWGRVFVEKTPISAETLWREFPKAMKAAETALANAKLSRT